MSTKNRGQSLVGVLVSASILAIVAGAVMSTFRYQSKAARNLAADGGLNDVFHGLDVLFGSPQCASMGTTTPLFLNGGLPAKVVVGGSCTSPMGYCLSMDTINFPNGSTALTSLGDPTISAMIQPYGIAGMTMKALGGQGPLGTGFAYPFQMQTTFSATKLNVPPPPRNKFVTFFTDATNKVIGGCSSGGKLSRPNLDTGWLDLMPTVSTTGVVYDAAISGYRISFAAFPNTLGTNPDNFVVDYSNQSAGPSVMASHPPGLHQLGYNPCGELESTWRMLTGSSVVIDQIDVFTCGTPTFWKVRIRIWDYSVP